MSVDMSKSHPAMDVEEHVSTYEGFITGFKICTVAVILVVIGMALFLL